MDVQPAQEPEWKQEPFKFRKEDGRYFGRGSTDDKGPGITALFAAKYAADNGIRLNIRFLWELEEEIGSPHFEERSEERREGKSVDLGGRRIIKKKKSEPRKGRRYEM